jgi:hypothetical protein
MLQLLGGIKTACRPMGSIGSSCWARKERCGRSHSAAGEHDWSCFAPSEQRAYDYASKLSKTPWELTAADYAELEKDLGPQPAMAVFWWLCRGLYMTRVSDGFQLPLERDNVFGDFAPKQQAEGRPGGGTSKR